MFYRTSLAVEGASLGSFSLTNLMFMRYVGLCEGAKLWEWFCQRGYSTSPCQTLPLHISLPHEATSTCISWRLRISFYGAKPLIGVITCPSVFCAFCTRSSHDNTEMAQFGGRDNWVSVSGCVCRLYCLGLPLQGTDTFPKHTYPQTLRLCTGWGKIK